MEEENIMRRMLRAILQNALKWRLSIGRNPDRMPGRSIILFPAMPDVLFCGLAGILVIKGNEGPDRDGTLEILMQHFARVKADSLEKVLSQSAPLSSYLNPDALVIFEKDLYGLKQNPGAQWKLFCPESLAELGSLCSDMSVFVDDEERLFEKKASSFSTRDMEVLFKSLIHLKDISWGRREDVLKNQGKIKDLSGRDTIRSLGEFEKYQRINFTLNALDRLEVRGRDSCGIQVVFQFGNPREIKKMVDRIKASSLYETFMKRCSPGDVWDRSIHISPDSLIFTYKTALITGDLGDNTRCLRKSIKDDPLLHLVVEHAPDSQMYLAHTRWASVGAINEANCHPVNSFSVSQGVQDQWDFAPVRKKYPFYGTGPWTINVVLNGDIDNYPALKESLESRNCSIDSRVTTDTKVIPLQIERYLYDGHDLKEAFRRAVNDFNGSHAIAMQSNFEPGKVFLALKGSGQSIYVGLCDHQYVFS
jgi:glutamine---fructose-6-phosphate transaminase (isomerizing)